MVDINNIRIEYVILIVFLVVFTTYIYLRLRYGFWYLQPVFHKYDISYYFYPPGIIQQTLPSANKYTNFQNIETISFEKMDEEKKRKFASFIKSYFSRNGENNFSPEYQNIIPYFRGTGKEDVTFLSFYKEKVKQMDSQTNEIVEDKKIIGTISSKPIYIQFVRENVIMDAYYVDYLCIDPMYRKKGIACQLIQTHEYNQRHINKNISVSIFKREEDLTGIIPICKFITYAFHTSGWTRPSNLHAKYKFLEINNQNMHVFNNFMKDISSMFSIIIRGEILELLKTENIYLHVVMVNDEILAAFFFRKTCIFLKEGKEFLSCFASIKKPYVDNSLFLHAFKLCCWKLLTEKKFSLLCIENISHNHLIIKNIQQKTKPFLLSPMAYYFYNFASHTFQGEKVLILL